LHFLRKPEVKPVAEPSAAEPDEDARKDAPLKQPDPVKRKNQFNGFFLNILKKFKSLKKAPDHTE
jgi:hypothetical protein